MSEKKFVMDGTLLLALVGAAAWLPQIISWLYARFVKPKLRFVPEEMTDIGYTSDGPILDQTFAIATSKKDALVEKIKLKVIHEDGEKHDFHWKFLDEKGGEIINPAGEKLEIGKHQSAIALKISTLGLAEKKIRFWDISYQNKLFLYIRAFQEKVSYLKKTKCENYQEEIIKTKEFLDILDFIKTGFCWEKGKYDVYLHAYETSLKNPHMEQFQFELSKEDIELLEKNIKEIQEWCKDMVLLEGKDIKEWPKRFWNWVYPRFYRAQ